MPSDDLSSIPGLEDKHLRALARQNVTDLAGLADADRQAIYRAMANLRPRPTLEQISRWQDDARNMLPKPETGASDWHPAASFVVVFSQRRAGDTWERRTEAERTEVEPEQNLQIWSGWDCEPICAWMMGQLDQADPAQPPSEPPPEAAAEPPSAEPAAGRAQLTIESATIIDAAGRADAGDGRRGDGRSAQGACRTGTGRSHGQRRTAGDPGAGRHAHPAPGRFRLEPPGSGSRPAFGPGRVRPVRSPGGGARVGVDRLDPGRRRQPGVGQPAQNDDSPGFGVYA